MNNSGISLDKERKSKMAIILFWLFVIIFAITSLFAFIALTITFIDPERLDTYQTFGRLVWALWGGVLAEVAAGIFALWQDFLGLKAKPKIDTISKKLGELIDGLEAKGNLSKEEAQALWKEYEGDLGSQQQVYK